MNTDRVELMIAFLDRLIALRNGPDKYFCTYEIEQVIDAISEELGIYEEEGGDSGLTAETIEAGRIEVGNG